MSRETERLLHFRRYQGVPESVGEHYWHNAGVKGNWSIVRPYRASITNAAQNPSFEVDQVNWFGINLPTQSGGTPSNPKNNPLRSPDHSIHGSFGLRVVTDAADQGAAYEMWLQFSFNTAYYACISINGPAGSVATFQFEYGESGISFSFPTVVTLPGYPIRVCTKFGPVPPEYGPTVPTLPISVRFDRAGEYSLDGLLLTTSSEPIQGYFDGDSPGGSWLGAPHASSSSIDGFNRALGEKINLNEIGFNVTGSTGFGLTPRQLLTTSFARINGAHFQRVKEQPRVITLSGTFEGAPEEMHEARNTLIDALIYRFKNQCTQELILTYCLRDECGCQISEEVEIPVEYQAGLEGLWGSLDRERATLTFVANTQQSFNGAFENSEDLTINGTSTIDYTGTDDAWVEVHMWPGGAGLNVGAIINDTTGHGVYFGSSAAGANWNNLPLLFGPPTRTFAILRTDPARRLSLDHYAYAMLTPTIPVGTAAEYTRIMHYIRYSVPANELQGIVPSVGLLRLVPGANQFRTIVTFDSGGSRILLRWRNRYLSVDHLCAGICGENG